LRERGVGEVEGKRETRKMGKGEGRMNERGKQRNRLKVKRMYLSACLKRQ